MSDDTEATRREAWQKIKIHAPGFAEDLKALTAAFGKPQALKATLSATGEEIEVGEFNMPVKVDRKTPVEKPDTGRNYRGQRFRRY